MLMKELCSMLALSSRVVSKYFQSIQREIANFEQVRASTRIKVGWQVAVQYRRPQVGSNQPKSNLAYPRPCVRRLSSATMSSSAHSFNKILTLHRSSIKTRNAADVEESIKKLRRLILVDGIPSKAVCGGQSQSYLHCPS